MKSLFVGSVSPYAGKNLTCIGIAKKYQKQGLKVGYFKPIGIYPAMAEGLLTDEDAIFYKKVLGLSEPLDLLSPVVMTTELISKGFEGKVDKLEAKILDSFKKVAKGKDLVIINGIGNLYSGSFLGIPEVKLIQKLKTKVLLVDSLFINEHESCDAFLNAQSILHDKLLGVILNRVLANKKEYARDKVIPFLKKKNIDTLGVILEDSILKAVTIRELAQILNGNVLCCEHKLDELVENFMIGAMMVESALKYFRRVPKKAVITGGDRSDIQLAALETPTKCLILTGDLYPGQIIISKAEELGVPIIVVSTDTLTAVDRIESLLGHLSLHSASKVKRAEEVIEKSVNFSLLSKKLGLK